VEQHRKRRPAERLGFEEKGAIIIRFTGFVSAMTRQRFVESVLLIYAILPDYRRVFLLKESFPRKQP